MEVRKDKVQSSPLVSIDEKVPTKSFEHLHIIGDGPVALITAIRLRQKRHEKSNGYRTTIR